MNRTIESFIIFCLGAGVGAGVFYMIYKPIRDKQEDDVVEAERERFGRREKRESEKNPGSDFSDFKPIRHKDEEEAIEDELTYAGMTEPYKNEAEEYEKPRDPYVINPIDYGNEDLNYDLVSLEYYADGILANEEDEIVDNAEELVGADFAQHFGEYEEDSVYVRNERLKTDFEILYNMKTYTEIHEPVFT